MPRRALFDDHRSLSGGSWFFRRPFPNIGNRDLLARATRAQTIGFRPARRCRRPLSENAFHDIRGSSHDDHADNVVEDGIVNFTTDRYENCGLRPFTRKSCEPTA